MGWWKILVRKIKFKEANEDVTAANDLRKDALHTQKEAATTLGEPWVSVLNVDLSPEDIGSGAFELDWNDIFVAKLIKAGYSGKTDADIVDRWFQDVCRHVVLESYQKEQADTAKRDLGNGLSEYK